MTLYGYELPNSAGHNERNGNEPNLESERIGQHPDNGQPIDGQCSLSSVIEH